MVMDYGWEKQWGKGEINIFGGRDDFVQYCDHLRTTGPPSPLIDWSSACQGTSFDRYLFHYKPDDNKWSVYSYQILDQQAFFEKGC